MPLVDRVGLSRIYHSLYGSNHTVAIDTFSLLGIGNVCQSSYAKSHFYDWEYDTSTFSKTFNTTIDSDDPTKVRKYMSSDGSEGEPYGYFLRSDRKPENDDDSYSAVDDDAYMHVSYVTTYGIVGSSIPSIFSGTGQPFNFDVPDYGGILPVCMMC